MDSQRATPQGIWQVEDICKMFPFVYSMVFRFICCCEEWHRHKYILQPSFHAVIGVLQNKFYPALKLVEVKLVQVGPR